MPTKPNNNRVDRGKNRKSGNVAPAKLTPEEQNEKLATDIRLHRKTKELIDILQANPKLSQAEAYMQLHDVKSKEVASAAASRALKSVSARIYSDAAVGKAKRRIVQLIGTKNESIALKASQDILDRNEGKAVQKTDITQRTVEVKLDLSGVRIGAHYIKPDQLPA